MGGRLRISSDQTSVGPGCRTAPRRSHVAPVTEGHRADLLACGAQTDEPMEMEHKHSAPASTTTLTKVLAVGVFACVGGGLVAVLAGASVQIVAAALVTGVVLAAGAALYEYRRAPETFAVRSPFDAAHGELIPAPLPEIGESWIGIDATFATRVNRTAWMAYVVPFLLLLPWVWLRNDISDPSLPVGARAVGRLMEIVTAVMVLTSAVAIIFMRQQVKRTLRRRIGADRTHLLYDAGTGKIERHEWSSVLTDKFQLLIGRHIVALAVFPVETLRPLVLARLPGTSFVTHPRLQWNALRRGNLPLWSIVSALCVMAVLTCLGELHPEWSKDSFEALMTWLRASVS